MGVVIVQATLAENTHRVSVAARHIAQAVHRQNPPIARHRRAGRLGRRGHIIVAAVVDSSPQKQERQNASKGILIRNTCRGGGRCQARPCTMDIEYQSRERHGLGMKRMIPLTLTLLVLATGTQAACFADYKAKRDDPLRLHYGVAEIMGACNVDGATVELAPRLEGDDWQLLSVEGVFDDAGLEERQESAGEYYLRY